MNLWLDESAQVSTELILLFAGIIVIVLIFMNVYQNYVTAMAQEIKDNELNDLTNKIDNISSYVD